MDNLALQLKKEHKKKVRQELIEGAAIGAAGAAVGVAVASGALPAVAAAKVAFVGGKFIYDVMNDSDSK